MIVRIIKIVLLALRWPMYKLKGNTFSITTTEIGQNTFLRKNEIGHHVFIGKDCIINDTIIGNYTCIASGVQIGGMEHPYWDLSMSPKLTDEYIFGNKTRIGHDVWIAAGCIIKQGVTIGDGAVVGANSFVIKDVPPYAIVFGTPSKIHKYRFEEKKIFKIQKSEFWKYSPQKAKLILNELSKMKDE